MHPSEALRRAADPSISWKTDEACGAAAPLSTPMIEIFQLQPRFAQRQGKRPQRLLTHPRFRAAYDFLVLRAQAGEAERSWPSGGRSFRTRRGEPHRSAGQRRPEARRRRRRRRRRPARGAAAARLTRCSASRSRLYVGLGSNLEDPSGRYNARFAELAALSARRRLTARSPLYKSRPWAPRINPITSTPWPRSRDTAHAPGIACRRLRSIEARHGRRRDGTRWGPRSLDLDLLLYGDVRCVHPD